MNILSKNIHNNHDMQALKKTKIYKFRSAYTYYSKHRHKFMKVLVEVLQKQGKAVKMVYVYDNADDIADIGVLLDNQFMNIMGIQHDFYSYLKETHGYEKGEVRLQTFNGDVIDAWLQRWFNTMPFNNKEYEALEKFIRETYIPRIEGIHLAK